MTPVILRRNAIDNPDNDQYCLRSISSIFLASQGEKMKTEAHNKHQRKPVLYVVMSPDMMEALREVSARTGESLSALTRYAIRNSLLFDHPEFGKTNEN